MNKIILNADDFGLSEDHNNAVLKGYNAEMSSSASLIVNSEFFNDAVNNVIKVCPKLNIVIHLNIMEGKPLTKCPLLCNRDNTFSMNYLYLILMQYNKEVQKQIENEFRAQIEKAIQNGVKINRLDSHVHTHAIPEIFKIVCKLAKEYNIEYVRTQFENPYLVFPECFSIKFAINLIKVALLDFFTLINRRIIKKYNIKTNDILIGACYTGMMSSKIISAGIKKYKDKIIEIIIHPCDDNKKGSQYKEFLITQDSDLKANLLNKM